jgi:hypothetical protein
VIPGVPHWTSLGFRKNGEVKDIKDPLVMKDNGIMFCK